MNPLAQAVRLSDMQTALEARRRNKPKQIDNASLHAGAPMTYYCRQCGHVSDVRGELNFSPVEHYCSPCCEMRAAGWSDEENRFVEVQKVTCEACNGTGEIREQRGSFSQKYTHISPCYACERTGTQLKRMDT